ncbi:hypothetical protein J3P71_06880 [Rhizobium leguminosarum]|uniref:hypothetical protein n=1 Tax=Rhizobium leguminosarum TaxID=384 RepID=UPI00144271E7|nr:hypothetical protein [Rhizobium leguminosarum]MBY5839743.1 hypothetical protein [Rhizobium leguminosarum]MBY5867172.1 hypothetical protein [Rhizobium leguminosarum]NKM02937.1 hypothetical protein [Rhizobium leguminosarum bv. viciae]NKM79448.1 hypothetical protein [Rhizobium leguminosarum bv. viciae]QSZ09479.1 hypothetical protein J3P71_06880 [Rhizobium leguminosarum]
MSRLLILSATAILAQTSLASAGAPDTQPLKISKECSEFTGKTPSFCTITESNFEAIPKGTKIFYHQPTNGAPIFTDTVTIITTDSGTVVGRCITFDVATPPTGTCAFTSGSGKLEGFQAAVNVSVDDKQIWHWDGAYLIGAAK